MSLAPHDLPDVMQVCINGHVITDRLQTCPEQSRASCERCGAATLDHCTTCGQQLPGAIPLPGPVPIGRRRPPQYCSGCGAAFPWTPRPISATPGALASLETLLRRLPRTIRQLRYRQGDRPTFVINDEHDLEDLVRAVLPLSFDDVRPQSRVPRYATQNRTDFLLAAEQIVLTVKLVTGSGSENALGEQWQEDIRHHQGQANCRTLCGFIYDSQGLLVEPRQLETMWSKNDGQLEVRCLIG
jgi:hypothetical protein